VVNSKLKIPVIEFELFEDNTAILGNSRDQGKRRLLSTNKARFYNDNVFTIILCRDVSKYRHELETISSYRVSSSLSLFFKVQ